MANRMILNETSYFGAGAISEIVTEAKKRAFKKALVVTDPDLVKFGVTANVTKLLDEADIPYQVFSDVKANPTVKVVKAGIEAFKAAGADFIVAVGGGSSMDTAKAIGIIITNPEFSDVTSLEGVADTKNPCVPIIAVPTTAGTAAEKNLSRKTRKARHPRISCERTNPAIFTAIPCHLLNTPGVREQTV